MKKIKRAEVKVEEEEDVKCEEAEVEIKAEEE